MALSLQTGTSNSNVLSLEMVKFIEVFNDRCKWGDALGAHAPLALRKSSALFYWSILQLIQCCPVYILSVQKLEFLLRIPDNNIVCRRFEFPSSIFNLHYGHPPILSFLRNPKLWQDLFDNIAPKKYRIKTKIN